MFDLSQVVITGPVAPNNDWIITGIAYDMFGNLLVDFGDGVSLYQWFPAQPVKWQYDIVQRFVPQMIISLQNGAQL